jgi:hypothetical protein
MYGCKRHSCFFCSVNNFSARLSKPTLLSNAREETGGCECFGVTDMGDQHNFCPFERWEDCLHVAIKRNRCLLIWLIVGALLFAL